MFLPSRWCRLVVPFFDDYLLPWVNEIILDVVPLDQLIHRDSCALFATPQTDSPALTV